MKKNIIFSIILLAALGLDGGEQDDYSHLIFPDPGEKICLVTADNKEAKMLSGKKVIKETSLTKQIMKELDHPFHRSVIKLNQCSRNLSANQNGPNVLFLSQNQGGFPRTGLVLTADGKTTEYPQLNYVDLVLDDRRLADGELYIFSHELGHVMMNNTWDTFGETAGENLSPKQHVSMGVTDYYKAFYEGWGIHFEAFANDIEWYRESFRRSFDYDKIPAGLWHSNIDRELRINAVLQDRYIYRKLLPAPDKTNSLKLEQLILLEHASPVFDKTRLKNAQQMLSCEGVIASLFFKINSNTKLQNNYRDKAFYQHFLLAEIPEGTLLQDIFTPFENVILKNFYVWQQLKSKGQKLKNKAPFIEFTREWCRSFPEDREELLRLFTAVTAGKTMSKEPAGLFEEMAFLGVIGDYYKYREMKNRYEESLNILTTKLLNHEIELDANMGPEIWIINTGFSIQTVLWSGKRKKPLAINLNTASIYEIATFPGISIETAAEIVAKRKELGFFKSVEEAKKAGFKTD